MKKIILLVAAVAFLVSGCNDEKSSVSQETYAEFVISANSADYGDLKSTSEDVMPVPMCLDDYSLDDYEYAYVKYTVGGGTQMTMQVPVYVVNGQILTAPIKVMMGTEMAVGVSIDEFVVYNTSNVPIKATPHFGSEFYSFIAEANALREITLEKFTKKEFAIDVLCYEELTYDYFGFIWFDIRPITVRSICIFGDICICDEEFKMIPYNHGDLGPVYPYEGQAGYDVIALTKVVITDKITEENGQEPGREYYNDVHNPSGECLEVSWADLDEDPDDMVKIELMVLLPVGDELDWVTVKTITTNADGSLAEMADGMIDFVVGACHEDADWVLPDLRLPADAVKMEPDFYGQEYETETDHRYVEIKLTEVPAGYSIGNGNYNGWCGDSENQISGKADTWIYSSLSWQIPFGNHLTQAKLDGVNYLMNRLYDGDLLAGFDDMGVISAAGDFTAPEVGQIVQTAIWKTTNPLVDEYWRNYTDEVVDAADQLLSDLGPVPSPLNLIKGDLAALLFYRENGVQILFTPVENPCIDVFGDDDYNNNDVR